MNLDELKATWQAYDEKIRSSQRLSEQMIRLMIKDRSKGTLANMARSLQRAGIIMTAVLLFFTAAILGNAFDYTSWYMYIPSVLYIGLATVALAVVVRTRRALSRVTLNQQNLYDSLTTVLHWHERAQATLSRVWMLCMLAGFLFGVSMVARKFETYGPTKVALFLGMQLTLILLIYGAARWLLNVFEDTHGKALREDLHELDQLKV
ncbi:hypothetical protein ACO2Q8_28345 [Larkinella sp. VNQ87]|uniref:hypothetical protein n=1 Tax=Larkinella sp. VNQ87 TaxID=3400921 RepID=UPI003C0A0594